MSAGILVMNSDVFTAQGGISCQPSTESTATMVLKKLMTDSRPRTKPKEIIVAVAGGVDVVWKKVLGV